MLSILKDQIVALGWVQWSAFISGLLYIYYATKNNSLCWPLGILSSGLWAYASFFQLKLYSDAWLQVIYVALGIWGWYDWIIKKNEKLISITDLSTKEWSIYLLICALLSVAAGMYMRNTNAAFPFTDAFLSVFSIGATLLLIQRKIENWLWWILIDAINIPLFIGRKGYLFAILFLVYGVLAVKGWRDWRRILFLEESKNGIS